MQIKRKPTATILFTAYVLWSGIIQPVWNLNIEKAAERQNLDTALIDGGAVMDWLRWFASYVPSSFGLGFVTGALIFAYWDNITGFVRRRGGVNLKPDMRAWIGNMRPTFDPENNKIELWISVINVGDATFTIKRVEGSVTVKTMDGEFILTDPLIDYNSEPEIHPNNYYTFSIHLSGPSTFWKLTPDMFIWRNPRTYMEFDGLSIFIASQDGTEKKIETWESMRLTTGEWEVCSVETQKIWKSDKERDDFQSAIGAIVKHFGAKL